MQRVVKVGSRKSKLAMVQTNYIIDRLSKIDKELNFEIIPISTVGDEILDRPLLSFGGKGVFVDAFEEALLNGSIDLAVHSAKDMTTKLPEGLGIIGIPEREDPRDIVISVGNALEAGKPYVIGTSSLRRQFQISQFYQAECKSLRGNVPTRLEKLKAGEFDGIILAASGMKRLGLINDEQLHIQYLPPTQFIPAAGQGILAVEGRVDDELAAIVRQINDADTEVCLKTERRVLELMNAGCHEAIGIYSRVEAEKLCIDAIFQVGDQVHQVQDEEIVENYDQLAIRVAKQLAFT
ncbi:MAG: porphobilinogen deaminase [Herbinix sp.]|jgi:hydroxymethylbilane synthase/uroporphyrinogen III methyltransferase/synthase|nr:porphobilinogen deaminase [Herbinix sp.]